MSNHHGPGAGATNPGRDTLHGAPGTDPAEHAPAGRSERDEKSPVIVGPGATSRENAESEVRAAREAGEYAAAVAGGDPDAAAPIPADDRAALSTPGTASSAPADSEPAPLDEDRLTTS